MVGAATGGEERRGGEIGKTDKQQKEGAGGRLPLGGSSARLARVGGREQWALLLPAAPVPKTLAVASGVVVEVVKSVVVAVSVMAVMVMVVMVVVLVVVEVGVGLVLMVVMVVVVVVGSTPLWYHTGRAG